MEKSNKLPEGVGKKIADALKQSDNNQETNHEDVIVFGEASPEAFYGNNGDDNSLTEENVSEFSFEEEVEIPELEVPEFSFDETYESETKEEVIYQDESVEEVIAQEETTAEQAYEETPVVEEEPIQYEEYTQEEVSTVQYETPVKRVPPTEAENDVILSENVLTLLKLIEDLPSGVTRQTGAQIIKQTMEALGISMTRVLAEAQQAHDKINQTVKNKLNTIQEYKQDIKALESQVQSFKKDAGELDDIISLFILTDEG